MKPEQQRNHRPAGQQQFDRQVWSECAGKPVQGRSKRPGRCRLAFLAPKDTEPPHWPLRPSERPNLLRLAQEPQQPLAQVPDATVNMISDTGH